MKLVRIFRLFMLKVETFTVKNLTSRCVTLMSIATQATSTSSIEILTAADIFKLLTAVVLTVAVVV